MKRQLYTITQIGLLSISLVTYGFGPKTFYLPRSQAVNAVRELVGWQRQIHLYNPQVSYGTVSATVEYDRSFRARNLAQLLFGSTNVTFSGSQVSNRGDHDILADYFGLPQCFKSNVCVNPVLSNVIVDFDWYQGFDGCVPGLYFIFHMPVTHSKANLHFHETVLYGTDGDACDEQAFYPAGYMGPVMVSRSDMSLNVTEAFIGKKTVGSREPLLFGRIFGREVRSRIAEIQLTLGYVFLQSDWYHLGLGARVALPTGNRPDMEFLFDATVGNGHHWEFGGQLTSHVNLWQSTDAHHTVALYVDANITHLFSDTQNRSYDLTGHGAGSRYVLLQEFATPSTDLQLSAVGPMAPAQFTGRILPAINVTTLKSEISVAVQADVVCKVAYQRADGFEFDFGYNLYARSKEKLDCRSKLPTNRFVLKGDAQVYGFNSTQQPVRLSVSQSQSTIYKGQKPGNIIGGPIYTNANADTPTPAFDGAGASLNQVNATDAASLAIAQAQINTSSPTKFLKDTDLDECSALVSRAISQTLFCDVHKAWQLADEKLQPYLGAGVAVELGGHCLADNSAVSQWRMWLKGGLSY